ncbi:Fc.00g033030.m01.CDS01 [Cosmosporella sp. VM-42]
MVFLEGTESEEQAKRLCKQLAPTPVLLNMVEGGITPHFTVAKAKEAGFKLIDYPGFALGPAYQAVSSAAKKLKELGDTGIAYANAPGSGPKEIFMICGMKEALEFDMAAGGKMYKKGV